jgi:hypothetical protein
MQYRPGFAILSLLLAISPRADAQVATVQPMTTFSNDVMTETGNMFGPVKLISNATFPERPGPNMNYLSNLFFVKGFESNWNPGGSVFVIDDEVDFRNCSNYQLMQPVLPDAMYLGARFVINRGVEIDGANSKKAMQIENLFSWVGVTINHSQLDAISLDDCNAGVWVRNDELHEGVFVIGNHHLKGSLLCDSNRFVDALSHIRVINWTLVNAAKITNTLYKNLRLNFDGDSILTDIYVKNDLTIAQQVYSGPEYGNRMEIDFQDCYIDGSIRVAKNGQLAKISFERCHFGPHATTISLLADTVSFEDCPNLPASAELQLTANHDICWLRLKRTNLGDASFIYAPNFHLAFDTPTVPDEYTSRYETLLSKFRKDGEEESYRRLDIEYHHFQAANGSRWDRIEDWAQEAWWNYGYSKLKVLLWTFLFLGVFFLFNALFWRGLQDVYPIRQQYALLDRKEGPVRFRIQELLRIFLYTVYVFFSIKIDPDRLKLSNLWLVCYFVFQWLAGLWCLFFIVNALLKIG